jgi:hypothetical protein
MLHDTVISTWQDKRKEKKKPHADSRLGGGETAQGGLWIPKEISYPAGKR